VRWQESGLLISADAMGNILDSDNYVNVKIFPNCIVTGNYICAVAGVYSPAVHGRNPEPFSNNLISYLIDAKASLTAKPNGPGQQRYVYVTIYE
jgi:hypothetical protein